MTTVNPSGVDVFCPLFSVGFTYGYLRPGPSRGHIHLPYPAPNFYVAHRERRWCRRPGEGRARSNQLIISEEDRVRRTASLEVEG